MGRTKEQAEQHYQEHKELYKESLRRRRKEKTQWFNDEIRAKCKCEFCGENHPACLDFHHKDATTKKDEVGRMVHQCLREEVILAEIAKCMVLCANCHRKLHWKMTK